MRIENFEQFKFQCKLAFLEDVLIEQENKDLKFVNLIKPKLNQTSSYLFPSIKLERVVQDFKVLEEIGFINLYSYFDKIELEHCLHILFNPAKSKLEEFEKILDKFKQLNTFVEITKLDENVYVISLIMFEEFKYIFYSFINSEYTKLGVRYAERFKIGETNGQNTYSKHYHIITHSEFLQDKLERDLLLKQGFLDNIELDKKIDLQQEILNYNYIKSIK